MQRIFLTGLAGAGKSTVGQHLASLLNWDLVETDALIAQQAGQASEHVLLDDGEERLHTFEGEILSRLADRERLVVATGEGIVIAAANRAFMQEHGLVVYLQTDSEVARQRAQQHRAAGLATQPILAAEGEQERLHALLVEHQNWYEEAASLHISTHDTSPHDITNQIVTAALVNGILLAHDSASISCNMRLSTAVSRAVIEWGSMSQLPEALHALGEYRRVFMVTDASVGRLYSDLIQQLLTRAGLQVELFTVPAGESSKSLDCFKQLIDWLVERHAEHTEPILAFGGGVVGDLVGFVAAAYHRGVPLVQLPTTLLAQVDSAIGGKTGINHELGKNLIGAFYQPMLTFVDPAVLLTLPERAYREGWAEIVKYGIILDEELFTLLEASLPQIQQRDPELLTRVVARCIRIKMDVVQGDERDGGLRNLLNYGHTFGHALEAITEYGTWLHGEAVSLGMEVAGRIAISRGLWTQAELERQSQLLQGIGLPLLCPGVDGEAILAAMQRDKKVRAGKTRWILPERIGVSQLYTDIPVEEVRAAIAAVCQSQEALR